jgi:hypothetical protein
MIQASDANVTWETITVTRAQHGRTKARGDDDSLDVKWVLLGRLPTVIEDTIAKAEALQLTQ